MKPIHYLGLVVRLFAICLFIYGLLGALEFITLKAGGLVATKPAFASIILMIIPIIIALYLWFFPLTVAHKLLGNEDHEFEPINPKSLLTILVASIGLFFLYQALMDVVYWISLNAVFSSPSPDMITPTQVSILMGMDAGDKAAIISTVIELAVALLLVVKCRSIAGLMVRIAR